MQNKYRGAIFDLDGVIADTARLHLAAWRALADDIDIPWQPDFDRRLKGLERRASLALILGARARQLREPELEQLASAKNWLYVKSLATLTPADLLPGAGELLAWLRANRVPTALASASKNAPAVLEALGIADRFAVIADPEQSAPKPAPDIFLAAAAGLGLAPADCLAFEDAAAGVAAIKAAGMTAIAIGCARELSGADAVLASLAEFKPEDFF